MNKTHYIWITIEFILIIITISSLSYLIPVMNVNETENNGTWENNNGGGDIESVSNDIVIDSNKCIELKEGDIFITVKRKTVYGNGEIQEIYELVKE